MFSSLNCNIHSGGRSVCTAAAPHNTPQNTSCVHKIIIFRLLLAFIDWFLVPAARAFSVCCWAFSQWRRHQQLSAEYSWLQGTDRLMQTHADSCRECRQQCCTNACTGWMFYVCSALAPGNSDVSVPLSSLNITICQYIRSEIVIWSQLTGDPASVDALNFWEKS